MIYQPSSEESSHRIPPFVVTTLPILLQSELYLIHFSVLFAFIIVGFAQDFQDQKDLGQEAAPESPNPTMDPIAH